MNYDIDITTTVHYSTMNYISIRYKDIISWDILRQLKKVMIIILLLYSFFYFLLLELHYYCLHNNYNF